MGSHKSLVLTVAGVLAIGLLAGGSVVGQTPDPIGELEFRPHRPTGSQPGDTIPSLQCTGNFQIFEDDFVRFDNNVPYVVKFPVLGTAAGGATTYTPGINVQWTPSPIQLIDRWNAGVWVDTNTFETTIAGFPAVVSQTYNSTSSWRKPSAPGPSYSFNFGLFTSVIIEVGPETRVMFGWGCTKFRFAGTGPNPNSQVGAIPLGGVVPNRVKRNALMAEMGDMFHHVSVRRSNAQ